jgi:hypothetical protein
MRDDQDQEDVVPQPQFFLPHVTRFPPIFQDLSLNDEHDFQVGPASLMSILTVYGLFISKPLRFLTLITSAQSCRLTRPCRMAGGMGSRPALESMRSKIIPRLYFKHPRT